MYRLMQPSDWAEVLALWQAQRGDTEEFVRGAVERFAGVQNVYSKRFQERATPLVSGLR